MLLPEAGIVSVLVVSARMRHRVEVGLIGRGGIVGLPGVLGTDVDVHGTLVQVDGQAWRRWAALAAA